MEVTILAWESLIWDPRNLEVRSDFRPDGPELPLEFSRISKDGRLTLVIDETHGTLCPSYTAISAKETFSDAKENLKQREGMTHINAVGFVDLRNGEASFRARERHPGTLGKIESWAKETKRERVIWTVLASNFEDDQKEAFGVDAAIRYLEGLSEEKRQKSLEYIRNAPAEVQTPVREAVKHQWPEG